MSDKNALAETRLYVCETCVRDLALGAEEKTRGRLLADAVAARLRALRLPPAIVYRTVLCLNGCPRPCNAALRAPGKCSLRLGQLTPADAPHIVDLLLEYSASADGEIPSERWPTRLRDKVTARVPPLGPRPDLTRA